jgi:hypothetical protein
LPGNATELTFTRGVSRVARWVNTVNVSSNSALIVYSDSSPKDVLRAYPVLDKPATRAFAEKLFPGAQIEEIGDELLADALDPPEGVAYLGCFSGLDLVCNWNVMPDRPSQLDPGVRGATERRQTHLYALHADADWCSYGIWQEGELVRAYSACPDLGIIEDVGDRLGFEDKYETYDELGEAACKSFFGIDTSDDPDLDDVDPGLIPVVGYRVTATVLSEERPEVALGDRH